MEAANAGYWYMVGGMGKIHKGILVKKAVPHLILRCSGAGVEFSTARRFNGIMLMLNVRYLYSSLLLLLLPLLLLLLLWTCMEF